jgi:hypothetical protein
MWDASKETSRLEYPECEATSEPVRENRSKSSIFSDPKATRFTDVPD